MFRTHFHIHFSIIFIIHILSFSFSIFELITISVIPIISCSLQLKKISVVPSLALLISQWLHLHTTGRCPKKISYTFSNLQYTPSSSFVGSNAYAFSFALRVFGYSQFKLAQENTFALEEELIISTLFDGLS